MTDELKTWSEEQAYERAKAEYMEKLNGIRAETMKLQTYKMFKGEDAVYVECEDVLQIIDKYRDKEQEDADND